MNGSFNVSSSLTTLKHNLYLIVNHENLQNMNQKVVKAGFGRKNKAV